MSIFTCPFLIAVLVLSVSGDECKRCQLIEYVWIKHHLSIFHSWKKFCCRGDPFDNYLWRFYEVGTYTCPKEDDHDHRKTACHYLRGGGRDECGFKYANYDNALENLLSTCVSDHMEVIGLSAPLGGTILALLVIAPVICICVCCRFSRKRGRKAEEPSEEINPTTTEERQHQTPSGSNLVTAPELAHPQAPPGFNLVPLSEVAQPQPPPGYKLVPLSELRQPQAPPPGYKLVPVSELGAYSSIATAPPK